MQVDAREGAAARGLATISCKVVNESAVKSPFFSGGGHAMEIVDEFGEPVSV